MISYNNIYFHKSLVLHGLNVATDCFKYWDSNKFSSYFCASLGGLNFASTLYTLYWSFRYAFYIMSHEYSCVLIQTTFSLETFVLSSSHWMKNDEGWMMMISSCHPSQEPHLTMFLIYIKSTYSCTNPDEHINLTDFRWNQLQMQQYADNLINFCMLQLILVWTTSHDTSAEKTLPACLFWHTLYVAWKK